MYTGCPNNFWTFCKKILKVCLQIYLQFDEKNRQIKGGIWLIFWQKTSKFWFFNIIDFSEIWKKNRQIEGGFDDFLTIFQIIDFSYI